MSAEPFGAGQSTSQCYVATALPALAGETGLYPIPCPQILVAVFQAVREPSARRK